MFCGGEGEPTGSPILPLMNKQLALNIPINTQKTLSNYCFGDNGLLQQTLNTVFSGQTEKCIYFFGEEGSGKSHLLQGLCQAFPESESALYLPLRILEPHPDILVDLEHQGLIAIDDIDLIAKAEAFEEALFHLFNRIKDNNRTFLFITGSYKPSQIGLRLPDLTSRLAALLTIPLHRLSDEEKISVLSREARNRGIDLPHTVAQFLLTHCSRNLTVLTELLDKLDNASLALQRKITIPFVKAVLNV